MRLWRIRLLSLKPSKNRESTLKTRKAAGDACYCKAWRRRAHAVEEKRILLELNPKVKLDIMTHVV
jgi:hypothetical protein